MHTLISDSEREKVREQMNRLLETRHFKHSRRYPALLRFIVEETLEGRGEYLKERLLGVRVFDRPSDYDTAADPIVRVTIAEIRKRIAQYYHDEEHDAEIRIELLPGRYAPEFRTRRDLPLDRVPSANGAEARSVLPATDGSAIGEHEPAATTLTANMSSKARYFWGAAVTSLLVLTCFLGLREMRPTALEQFWAPILASRHAVLFCLPTDVGKKEGSVAGAASDPGLSGKPELIAENKGSGTSSNPTFLDHEAVGENVVFSDVLATLNMANVLAAHHREYTVRLNVSTTLDDLRHGPVILVGGLDNPWTMRALAPLPFHFAGSDEEGYWIANAKDPGNNAWSLDIKKKYAAVTKDYALIARLHNEETGQTQVIVAGIGMSGTAAAGEFVADEQRIEELRRRVGAGFKDRDFEVVLGTDVVNGIGGSPKILAVSVW